MNITGYMLVMTGTLDLFPLMNEVFSPVGRQFKKINVGEFKEVDDTRNCIKKPLENLGIVPEELFDFETYRDVHDIHNLSGGRPYEIQLICHVLFRRVETKRAEKMKLDFSVLDEVRRELETLQNIANRPLLHKIRNFSREQLAALILLCSCNGNATFDQVWGIEYIFHGESSWKKDRLKETIQLFSSEGLLKIDEDLISFAGDDFDRIYTKYFAREQGISSKFLSDSIETVWQERLTDLINTHFNEKLVILFSRSALLFVKGGDISGVSMNWVPRVQIETFSWIFLQLLN